MLDVLRKQLKLDLNSGEWSALAVTAHRLKLALLGSGTSVAATDNAVAPPSSDPENHSISYLVTGGAGFIGSHLARRLLGQGHRVVVVDEFNDYYDPILKWGNVADLLSFPSFSLHQADIRDADALRSVFASRKFDVVVHLAARAGVRPSIVDPTLYLTSNVLGTQNMLDMVREFRVPNFVYASSSSVYGGSKEFPFSETQNVDNPISPYAVSKKANEVQAACYSRLYGIPMSGLRFFTVYGPGGRPDMAIRLFIEKMDRGEPIPLYGDGSFERDYTYIDDIIEGIMSIASAAFGREGWNEVFNLGESDTTSVLQLILLIAAELGKVQVHGDIKALNQNEQRRLIEELAQRGLVTRLPEQLGDVPKTFADITKACQVAEYRPKVDITQGIRRTVRWHLDAKQRATEPKRECLFDAMRIQCCLRARAGLDSAGRRKDPRFGPGDARDLTMAIAQLDSMLFCAPLDEPFARRVVVELADMLGQVASYLAHANGAILRGGSAN